MEARKQGKQTQKDPEVLKGESTLDLQRRMRGVLARKEVDKLRNEEMQFLGMSRKA